MNETNDQKEGKLDLKEFFPEKAIKRAFKIVDKDDKAVDDKITRHDLAEFFVEAF